jgi:hypothetical protein
MILRIKVFLLLLVMAFVSLFSTKFVADLLIKAFMQLDSGALERYVRGNKL